MLYLKYYFTTFLLVSSLISKGQHTFRTQWHSWFRYYNQATLNKNFVLHTEIDERILYNPSRQFQFFTHIHLHYRVKPWLDVAAGGNFNLTNSAVNTSLAVPEWRPWQEVSLISNEAKQWQFQFRYRLDERFIHNNDKLELTEVYHFNLRHRFRVQASVLLFSWHNAQSLTLRVSDEVMLNTGDVPRWFDQNRLYAGLTVRFNDRWSLESGYLNLLQPKTDSEFYERNIIRTTLYHRIRLGN